MAGLVTEFAYFPTVNANFSNAATLSGSLFTLAIDTVVSQPGVNRAYWGMEIESPDNLLLFVDWNDYDNSRTYDILDVQVGDYLDKSSGFITTINTNPFPIGSILDHTHNNVTLIYTAYFPSNMSSELKADIEARWEKYEELVLKPYPPYKGQSWGWSTGNNVPVKGEEGKFGKMFSSFIPWPSIEVHHAEYQTEAFLNNSYLLNPLPELILMNSVHIYAETKVAPKSSSGCQEPFTSDSE